MIIIIITIEIIQHHTLSFHPSSNDYSNITINLNNTQQQYQQQQHRQYNYSPTMEIFVAGV